MFSSSFWISKAEYDEFYIKWMFIRYTGSDIIIVIIIIIIINDDHHFTVMINILILHEGTPSFVFVIDAQQNLLFLYQVSSHILRWCW